MRAACLVPGLVLALVACGEPEQVVHTADSMDDNARDTDADDVDRMRDHSRPETPMDASAMDDPAPDPEDPAGGAGAPDPEMNINSPSSSDGRFDPSRVYLGGTQGQGACFVQMIAPPEDASRGIVGLPCEFSAWWAWTRAGGVMLYHDLGQGKLREFSCDEEGCYFVQANRYPEHPRDNDPEVPSPCTGGLIQAALLAPDDSIAFRCSDPHGWLNAAGDPLYSGMLGLWHLGPQGTALAGTTEGVTHVVQLGGAGVETPITDLPEGTTVRAIRASESGFYLVTKSEPPELWEIATTGAATQLGTFPPLPDGQMLTSSSTGQGAALDATLALYDFTTRVGSFPGDEDTITRRTMQNVSEVVYTEATRPLVLIDGNSGLFTSPQRGTPPGSSSPAGARAAHRSA
jgi:hypothetical protein